MRFWRYCKDKWVSLFLFAVVFLAGGALLLLIETPFAVACVVEAFYAAGFFLILVQDFFARKGFYDQALEADSGPEEISYLSEFLKEPSFLEGQLLYRILQQDEKYMHDQIAGHQRELEEYKEYVETWAHEIKTPIAVSRLIMNNHRDDVTRSLSKEMDRLERLVEQMLYYSKSSSLHEDYRIAPVSLRELVAAAVKRNAKQMIGEKVNPRFENLDYTVLTDTKWMDFILGQIISNAVKYRALDRKAEIVFSAVQEKKTVTLSAADNGIGIPAEDLGRIFHRGFTGKNGRNYAKSTGMGLYLCHTLCRKLGVEISAFSTEGEGTVIVLKLAGASGEESSHISKM